jgi:3'(2'), 5'-bisphosphate nucleotidase
MINIDTNTLDAIVNIAHEAGKKILTYYKRPLDIHYKDDHSPLSNADLAAHTIICQRLKQLTPTIPVISEEQHENYTPPTAPFFWLVDPLDGTKEFIHGHDEFTVNIALIYDQRPVLGVIHAPALQTTYAGFVHAGAYKIISSQKYVISVCLPQQDLSVLTSRYHADLKKISDFLLGQPIAQTHAVGSSLKFCKIAEGEAHLYLRLGTTMEWDTAAGDAILTAAGGIVTTLSGAPLLYGKPCTKNPHFIAKPRELVLTCTTKQENT